VKARALVAHAADDVRLEDVELPDAGPHDAVVRIVYGGICGSDIHYWKSGRVGESVLKEPMILGHEVVGVVDQASADGSGPAVGTQVYVRPAQTCGHCRWCLAGRRNLCENLRYMGSAASLPHTNGGFVTRMAVPVERLVDTSGLDLRDAALIEPASVAWHAVGRLPGLGFEIPDSRVAVIGAGPIGLLCVAALVARGAGEIIATDRFERPMSLARELGATSSVIASQAEGVIRDWNPDFVIESSGSAAGFALGVGVASRGGAIVAVGQLPAVIEAPVQRIVTNEITITGSSRYFDDDLEVIAALREGRLPVGGIVTHVIPVDRYADALALASDSASSSKVLLGFDGA
jgi:L-idonate 5-dehydrogenase